MLDLRTLALMTMVSAVVFFLATLTIWRLLPEERSLRQWAAGALLLAVSTLLLGLRGAIPDFISIVVANALLALSLGYIYVGTRSLFGAPPGRPWHWLAAGLIVGTGFAFTYILPSLAARIVAVSTVFGAFLAASVPWFWRGTGLGLRATERITALVFAVGALLFFVRALKAPWAAVSPDFTATPTLIIALPYLYSTLFNVWLSIMLTLEVSARLQRRLADARDRAEAANRAKSVFLATMSHEIRTPMNGILGMAQLLQMPGLGEEERIDYARTIVDSGHTLMTLLNDILDLSKIEAGKFALIPSPFAPQQLVEEIAALFAEPARAKGVEIVAAWRGEAGQRYRADPVRLRQMLSNLVSNAVKFSRQGTVRVEGAEIGRAGNAAVLEFAVTDKGIGIPPDKQALLFQPFSQADGSTTREYGGTGLGLSIVRSLARLMDGDVGVDSKAGEGARFWFRIKAELVPEE